MKRRSRRLIVGSAAITVLGVVGTSVAASDSQQAAPANQSVASALKPHASTVRQAQVAPAEAEPEDNADSGDDSLETEVPITGTDLDKASAVALDFTQGGRVTETEVGDEESYYEVEVTLDDGRQIDVQLDENFNVVGSEVDG